ncbi:hypothetical protein L2E82_15845 [Cichorium intybus]|uniref:Uncharacterized protein n=1 Tax=Cichorium intybus TaxID=13427 RepID=A0ACB9F4D2_CICIN|nr:hypothetical protein L2E82_15845 [Cichorium intybus]
MDRWIYTSTEKRMGPHHNSLIPSLRSWSADNSPSYRKTNRSIDDFTSNFLLPAATAEGSRLLSIAPDPASLTHAHKAHTHGHFLPPTALLFHLKIKFRLQISIM